jgi:hypothetical protein
MDTLSHRKILILLQIRLDFNTFMITGPTTVTLTVGFEVGGSVVTAAGKAVRY